jgi:hypothetical protein
MSNAFAIAAVTATLQNLLTKPIQDFVSGSIVTVLPPDKVTASDERNQINIFLYRVSYDAALANMTMEGNRLRPFDAGLPPVPLVLHYMVSAYSDDAPNSDVTRHKLLGKAMSVLHDHPLLGSEELKTILDQDMVLVSDIDQQIERVRITRDMLSIDDMSKLWTTFQTAYRISAAYQVSAVLIESTLPARSPLPVLTRGKDDKGIESHPDLMPPFPTLTEIVPPKKQPSLRLGETLSLKGFHLDGSEVSARFKHPKQTEPIFVDADESTALEAKVTIPADDPENWPAGIYTVSLFVKPADDASAKARETNELAVAISPEIVAQSPAPDPPLPVRVVRDVDEKATFTLECRPHVWPEQTAFLLFSDGDARQVKAQPHGAKTDLLTFVIEQAPISEEGIFIRLRIDGVDSLLVKDHSVAVPKFDTDQKVIIDG